MQIDKTLANSNKKRRINLTPYVMKTSQSNQTEKRNASSRDEYGYRCFLGTLKSDGPVLLQFECTFLLFIACWVEVM